MQDAEPAFPLSHWQRGTSSFCGCCRNYFPLSVDVSPSDRAHHAKSRPCFSQMLKPCRLPKLRRRLGTQFQGLSVPPGTSWSLKVIAALSVLNWAILGSPELLAYRKGKVHGLSVGKTQVAFCTDGCYLRSTSKQSQRIITRRNEASSRSKTVICLSFVTRRHTK